MFNEFISHIYVQDRSLTVVEFPKLIVVELSSSLTYPAIDYIKDRIISIGQQGYLHFT